LISEDKLFIDLNGRTLIALSVKTGDIAWKYHNKMNKLHIHTNAKMLQTDTYIFYIFSNYKIITLKKSSGLRVQTRNLLLLNENVSEKIILKHISDINIYNNTVYICYDNGTFIALDIVSGRIIWKKNKNNYKNVIIDKNMIMITKKNGHITFLNRLNGKKLWTNRTLKNKILIKPVILNKKQLIIIGDNKGVTYILNKKNGKIIKQLKIHNEEIKFNFIDESKNIIIVSKNNNVSRLTF